jgi:hypothetical protein
MDRRSFFALLGRLMSCLDANLSLILTGQKCSLDLAHGRTIFSRQFSSLTINVTGGSPPFLVKLKSHTAQLQCSQPRFIPK